MLAMVIYVHQGRILRGGVDRCAPPLRIFAPLLKGHAPPPWESFNDGTK